MQDFKGCNATGVPLTLYRLSPHDRPVRLGTSYHAVKCGYRPPTRMPEAVFLCEHCEAHYGLIAQHRSMEHSHSDA